ncbi:MAG TPA: 4-(cytidine 5'-diphospho)-2-C-methyl-D-erythritol kinase [Chitinophagaceae bacterium]|nr:4-(cytidine 5'-diphospho)-2-C-methyl-D-erythritol kinase [Chitinophagaceae bacterium]
MVVFPNCKINLGLNIVSKREDGYHDLETVFYPIGLRDALEIIKIGKDGKDIHLSTTGKVIDGEIRDNLCVKAHRLLKNNFPNILQIKMHLHKTIPSGAGLGGGSSDGAFTLKLLNHIFDLRLSTEKLLDYALQLGSDCPFFIINKPCFATGRGEFLEKIELDLSAYKLVIINPGIHVNTTEVFSMISPIQPSKSIKKIIQQPIETWEEELKNDFEEPVFKKYPVIKSIKDELYKAGAVYASMTGSGSTVYGIFEKNKTPQFSFPSNYFIKNIQA